MVYEAGTAGLAPYVPDLVRQKPIRLGEGVDELAYSEVSVQGVGVPRYEGGFKHSQEDRLFVEVCSHQQHEPHCTLLAELVLQTDQEIRSQTNEFGRLEYVVRLELQGVLQERGVQLGDTVWVRVAAGNRFGLGKLSSAIPVVMGAVRPAPPQVSVLSASPFSLQLHLQHNQQQHPGVAPVTCYHVTVGPRRWTLYEEEGPEHQLYGLSLEEGDPITVTATNAHATSAPATQTITLTSHDGDDDADDGDGAH